MCYCFTLVLVFSLEASLGNPASERLTANHVPPEDQNLQTVVHNNSQETENLRGHLGALESQVASLCDVTLGTGRYL